MKWTKFLELVEQNPDIGKHIRQHIGSPLMQCMDMSKSSERKRRDYVESKVEFVTFRPLGDISLEARDMVISKEIHLRLPNAEAIYTPPRFRQETRITNKLYFHIGDEQPFDRMVYVGRGDIDSPQRTVRECLIRLADWHAKSWPGKPATHIVFDCLVHTSKVWDEIHEGVSSERHSLFRFPADFLIMPTKAAAA